MGLAKDLYDKFVGSLQQGPLVKDDVFLFGTVTSVHPIKVQIDGDESPATGTPILLVPDAVVGSRVMCQLHGRQLIVTHVVRDPIGRLPELGNTEHLDTFLDTGVWQQSANADTSTARGYPIAQAGLLEVFRGYENMAYQRYTNYLGSRIFSRSYYNGSWSEWAMTGGTETWSPTNSNLSSPFTIRSGYPVIWQREGAIVNVSMQLTTTASISAGATIFAAGVMPASFRPSGNRNLAVAGQLNGTAGSSLPNGEIFSDGTLRIYDFPAPSGGLTALKMFGTYHL